jgi:hypothetical protein
MVIRADAIRILAAASIPGEAIPLFRRSVLMAETNPFGNKKCRWVTHFRGIGERQRQPLSDHLTRPQPPQIIAIPPFT